MKTKRVLTNYSEAYSYALDKLSLREYSQKELEAKLLEASCPPEVLAEVMHKLLASSYLSDERHAQMVYRAWLAKKYYGRMHLRQYLSQKLVAAEEQKLLLQEFTPEEEEQRAEAYAQKQYPKYKRKYKDDTMKLKAALARTLASHGFGGDFMWSIIAKLTKED